MPEIHFAQIREDCLVERALQAEHPASRIVCIGSGGCTALSLLRDNVELVYAVDMNPGQCALIELKKESLRELDRGAYLEFIGESPAHDRVHTYARLAGRLPSYARAYWDARQDAISVGINQCGTTERFYHFVSTNLRKNVCGDEVLRALFDCGGPEAQRAFYEQHFTTESWRAAVRVLLSRTTHLLFFPAFMFAQATEHDLGRFFAAQFEAELLAKSVSNNYFLSQFLFSSYLPERTEGIPHYISEAGYAEAQRNLDKLAVLPQTLQAALDTHDGIDAFFLSNIFDWADAQDIERICRGILRSGESRAWVLYRNMLSARPLPLFFRDKLVIDSARCTRLRALERSMLYQQIVCGEIA